MAQQTCVPANTPPIRTLGQLFLRRSCHLFEYSRRLGISLSGGGFHKQRCGPRAGEKQSQGILRTTIDGTRGRPSFTSEARKHEKAVLIEITKTLMSYVALGPCVRFRGILGGPWKSQAGFWGLPGGPSGVSWGLVGAALDHLGPVGLPWDPGAARSHGGARHPMIPLAGPPWERSQGAPMGAPRVGGDGRPYHPAPQSRGFNFASGPVGECRVHQCIRRWVPSAPVHSALDSERTGTRSPRFRVHRCSPSSVSLIDVCFAGYIQFFLHVD